MKLEDEDDEDDSDSFSFQDETRTTKNKYKLVVHLLEQFINFEGEIIFDTDKPDGQFKKTASNAKLRSFKPDYQFTKIEDGVQKACDWFVENYEKARKQES